MKIYFLTEGNVETKVFRNWVPYILHNYTFIELNKINKMENNSFTILNGKGFNRVFSMIEKSIDDVNTYSLDRLVIQVDSDENDVAEVVKELEEECSKYLCNAKIRYVVSKPCFEAWCLGNSRLPKRNPVSEKAIEYINLYDVRTLDPEGIPSYAGYNSSNFAYHYLRAIFNDRSLRYSKAKPNIVYPKYFFDQVHSRFTRTSDIQTFGLFLDSLVSE